MIDNRAAYNRRKHSQLSFIICQLSFIISPLSTIPTFAENNLKGGHYETILENDVESIESYR